MRCVRTFVLLTFIVAVPSNVPSALVTDHNGRLRRVILKGTP